MPKVPSPKVSSPTSRAEPSSKPSAAVMKPASKEAEDRARPSLRPVPYVSERDFADALYKPHTVFAAIVLFGALYAYSRLYPSTSELSNIKQGLAAAAWVFIAFGVIHLPDSIMIRPHPAVWRGVLAIAVLYLMFLIFMLFQDFTTVKTIFGYYDPALRNKLPERSYATDCRMSTEEDPHKFWHTVADEFIIAHLGGYWAKTLVLRDWRIVTAVSLGFELLEVTFQHILPNFAECWWDHLIVDGLICNAGGTVLGMLTLKFLNAKRFHWVRLADIPSVQGKATRVLKQFAPRDGLLPFKWNMFDSPKRFFQVMMVLAVMFLQELNCFTMKFMLEMKPSHHLVIGRLAMWGIIALPGTREFYDFISEPTTKRLGATAWVGSAALIVETLWIIKMAYAGNYFTEPFPIHVAVPWLYAIVAAFMWLVLYFGLPGLRRRNFVWRHLLNLVFFSVPAAWIAIFLMANKDIEWYQRSFDAAVGPTWKTLF